MDWIFWVLQSQEECSFLCRPEFSIDSDCGERCRELIDAADEMTRRLYCVVDWLALHPEYNPKTKVIPKKDYPVLVDVTF